MISREQLTLALDYGGVPWYGASPRVLTRAHLGVILKAGAGEKDDRFFFDPDQFELFPVVKRKPPPSEGAPTLIPLPWEVR